MTQGCKEFPYKVIVGDCRESLKVLKQQGIVVQTCVTSPPYFGLRDYGHEGQLGLEMTPEKYIENMVEVFRGVKDILADDGTLWVNIGDSYAAQRSGTHQPAETLAGGKHGKTDTGGDVNRDRFAGYNPTRNASAIGLKHKDLIGIPWMLAFALRADGWYLRQDIIWHKPNPMPESVRDRCTKAHEYVFLFSKSQKYYFDNEAIKEPSIYFEKDKRSGKGNIRYEGKRTQGDAAANGQQSFVTINETKNKRSVWSVPTRAYKGAHFATFPPELIEPCILAGSREGDIVIDPFGGSGTAAGVSAKHGRRSIMLELNPEYAGNLVDKRVRSIAGDVKKGYYWTGEL